MSAIQKQPIRCDRTKGLQARPPWTERGDESKDFYLIREKEMIEKMERGWNKALREGSARVPCSCKLKKTRSHQELRK